MYKIKIFIKSSVKKLKKLSSFKGKGLLFFFNSLVKENNPNLNVVVKKLNIFLFEIKRMAAKDSVSENLIEKIYIYSILFSPSKKLKRINYRAKGRADVIEKRNTFITLILNKKDDLDNKNESFSISKNYKIINKIK